MKKLIFILLLCLPILSYGEGIFSGSVRDNQFEELIGATIQIGDKSYMTDIDGAFFIPLEEGTYKIKVKYVSFKESEFEIKIEDKKITSKEVILKDFDLDIKEPVLAEQH